MKPFTSTLMLFSLVLIAEGNMLSVFKRSVTDVNEDVVSIRKAMQTLNMTIEKFFKKLEDDLPKGLLDCEEDIHSILKRSAARNEDRDIVSLGTIMKTMNMTLENVFKKFEDCLSKRSRLICKDIEEPRNCAEVLNKCGGNHSGVYTINPDGRGAFKVYCDQKTNGGGWTVLQRRKDGSVDFYRGWDDYKNGFGDLKSEFWLGLDKIYRLTNKTRKRLRVDLGDHEGNSRYAEYDYFAVSDERNKYRLEVRNYTGTACDSLSHHRGQPFTTKDRDNDVRSIPCNCAVKRKGAWWFKSCMWSHLNGVYHQTSSVDYAMGVNWYEWKGDLYSLKKTEMKIRPTEILIKDKTNAPNMFACYVPPPPPPPPDPPRRMVLSG